MNESEIERIAVEAQAEEMAAQPEGEQTPPAIMQPTDEEFADFLDMAAKIAGHGFALPTIPMRFNHGANLEIARAAIKLCEKYGIDPRAVLIGQDSTLGAWIGLLIAMGLPGYACFQDYKAAKAQQVKQERADDGAAAATNEQQPSQ